MAKKRRTPPVVWLRRASQTAFLTLFLYLFLETVYHPINRVGSRVTLFFDLDPLVLFVTWLASHAVAAGMLLSLVTLGVTFFCGRWFCGWVCPFGALHHALTAMRGSRVKAKLDTGGYGPWQKAKYYVLAACAAGALLGVNIAGWLDPFSFFFRSLATAVYPALNDATVSLFTWVYRTDPRIGPVHATSATEPVYEFLRRHFLAAQQPHYSGNLLIGALFGIAIALNFWRPRFWCRYVCPLGALLGITGANPLVRLERNESACDQCRLCLAECQGGARTTKVEQWKAAECFYCFNCEGDCPQEAISIGFGRKESK